MKRGDFFEIVEAIRSDRCDVIALESGRKRSGREREEREKATAKRFNRALQIVQRRELGEGVWFDGGDAVSVHRLKG